MAVYDLTREDWVLRTYFTDATISVKMAKLMEIGLYKDETNKTIVRLIRGFVRKYGRQPSGQELLLGVEKHGLGEEVRNKILTICNSEIPPVTQSYCVSLIENFYQEASLSMLIREQAIAMNENRLEDVKNIIPMFKERINFSLHMNLGLDLVDDIEEAQRRLRETVNAIPSGVAEVNHYTTPVEGDDSKGGYPRQALTLYVGQPNVGKSLILCSEAGHAVRLGYNVLYITLELSEAYVWRRITANVTGVKQGDVCNLTPDECRQMMYDSKNPDAEHFGTLKIKHMRTTTTTNDIEALVDSFTATTGKKIDLLVIDYIGIMKPNKSGAISEQSQYLDGQAKAEQIRELCIERNIAGLSAIQFNRTGYSNIDAGLESVSGSSAYSETGDLIITITKDPVLASLGMYAHWIKKNRMGPNEIPFKTRCDFSTMRWFTATEDELHAEEAARIEFETVQASISPQPVNRPNGAPPRRRERIQNQTTVPQKTMDEVVGSAGTPADGIGNYV